MANGVNKISLTVGGTFRKGKQVTQNVLNHHFRFIFTVIKPQQIEKRVGSGFFQNRNTMFMSSTK